MTERIAVAHPLPKQLKLALLVEDLQNPLDPSTWKLWDPRQSRPGPGPALWRAKPVVLFEEQQSGGPPFQTGSEGTEPLFVHLH